LIFYHETTLYLLSKYRLGHKAHKEEEGKEIINIIDNNSNKQIVEIAKKKTVVRIVCKL